MIVLSYVHWVSFSYQSQISFSDLPFVSMTYFWLKRKPKNEQAAQKMNKGAGVLNALFRIGNKIVIKVAPAQLAPVLKGIRSGYNTSGIQSQTTGPRDNPKSAIKMIKPPIIIIFPIVVAVPSTGWSDPPLTKNPTPISNKEMTAMKVPPWRICFLPSLVNRQLVRRQVKVCSKFMMTGMKFFKSLKTLAAISVAQITTAFMPTNC